jgi:hypothetical protein
MDRLPTDITDVPHMIGFAGGQLGRGLSEGLRRAVIAVIGCLPVTLIHTCVVDTAVVGASVIAAAAGSDSQRDQDADSE